MRSSTLISAFALVAACAVAGGPVAGQTPTVVRIGALPIDVSGEPFYAQDLGYFKQAGLDAQITVLNNGAAVAAAILGGAVDIGVSNVISAALGHEKGLPLVMIAPGALYSTKAPTTVCAVAKSSPLVTAKDLNGKILGLPDLSGLPRIAFSSWMEKNGADLSSVKMVEVPFSAIVPALTAGRIDASVLVNPNLQKAIDTGEVRVLANCLDAIAPEFSLSEFYTTKSYAAEHPDVVRRFAEVIARTARWANAHHDESAKILQTWTKSAGRSRRGPLDLCLAPERRRNTTDHRRHRAVQAPERAARRSRAFRAGQRRAGRRRSRSSSSSVRCATTPRINSVHSPVRVPSLIFVHLPEEVGGRAARDCGDFGEPRQLGTVADRAWDRLPATAALDQRLALREAAARDVSDEPRVRVTQPRACRILRQLDDAIAERFGDAAR